jgi:hypothetical protein
MALAHNSSFLPCADKIICREVLKYIKIKVWHTYCMQRKKVLLLKSKEEEK